MASEQDPLDLVALFGLSEEEALGLGLPYQGVADTAPVTPPLPATAPPLDDASRFVPVDDSPAQRRPAPAEPVSDGANRDVLAADRPVSASVEGDLRALEREVLRVLGTTADAPPVVPPVPAARFVDSGTGPKVEDNASPDAAPPARHRHTAWLLDDEPPGAVDDRTIPQPSALELLLRRLPRQGEPRSETRVGEQSETWPLAPTDDAFVASDGALPSPTGELPHMVALVDEPSMQDVAAALDIASEAVEPPPAFLQELLDVFVEEATELLDGFHTTLEVLERAPSQGALAEARRQVHTIKGGARMCGLNELAELAHVCEDVLALSIFTDRSAAHRSTELLFHAEQEMRRALGIPTTARGAENGTTTLIVELMALGHAGDGTEAPLSAPEAPSPAASAYDAVSDPAATESESPAVAFPDTEALSAPEQRIVPVATRLSPHLPTPAPARGLGRDEPDERSGATRRASSSSPQGGRMAVDLQKVEGVVAKVTEIVANRATSHTLLEGLSANVMEVMRTVHRLQAVAMQLQYQIASAGLDVSEDVDAHGLEMETYGPIKQSLLQLHEAIADQQALVQETIDAVTSRQALAATETRLDTDLQSALLNMRLLPLSQLRVRLDQVVRSTAASAGREVRWSMEGQHVALDKTVCDRLFEPLMHLLRNAIDHGIEPPEERLAKGKPRVGRIVVQATVDGNQATISVSDDGRGIDPAHIASMAVARGVITAGQAAAMSDTEKMELIFRPGFSTAGKVTELSGRGVGMEIVRETCTRMGGTVSVSARPGGGTTTALHVPLSLSLIHALIVRDAGRRFCVPASQVVSVHLVRPAALQEQGGRQWVRIGRESLPLFRLPPPPAPLPGASIVPSEELTVLLVPLHNGRVGVVVDELVTEEDLIVKPLPLLLHGVDRLLGAVVLSSGEAIPVLNLPPQLAHLEAALSTPTVLLTAVPSARSDQVVLVVDDSLTMRSALTQTLASAGFTVMAARDGQEALELIRTRGMPRLVTLDVEMPRMDGLETLYAIRHLSGGEHVPVFMLSTRSAQKYQRTALQLGATRYFTKPYHDREFLRAVREVTGAPLRPAG